MKIVEAHANRNRVKNARGSITGVPAGPDYNVLVMVIDDAGIDWFRQYYERWGAAWEWASSGTILNPRPDPVLPFFEQMADEGLLFYDAHAAPICGPTRSGIQTGRFSFRHGHNINIRDPGGPVPGIGNYFLPASELCLAEYIKSQRPDYVCGQFAKHHMADQYAGVTAGDVYGCPVSPPSVNLTHSGAMGFDHYDIHPANIGGAYTYWRILNGVVTGQVQGDATATFDETTYPTAVFGNAAINWLAARGNDPWYCYVAFGPPHGQFSCPPYSMLAAATQLKLAAAGLSPGDTASGSSVQTSSQLLVQWKAAMEATDEMMRRVWASLTPEVRARTLLIITGDNGTTAEGVLAGFNHSKRTIFWGGTRVPLVIRGPGVANAGERVHSIVAVQDFYDTITDTLGLERAPSVRDSVSLVPLLQGKVSREDLHSVRDYAYVSLGTNQLFNGVNEFWAMYDGRWRGGQMFGQAVPSLTDEFSDPLEATNVASLYPEEYARILAAKVALVGS